MPGNICSSGSPWVDGVLRGRGGIPSGRSTGAYEAYEFWDSGARYNGLDVHKAVRNVNEVIGKEIIGMDVTEQRKIDELMIILDSTKQKSNLGANAILGIAVYRYLNPDVFILPVPMMKLVN